VSLQKLVTNSIKLRLHEVGKCTISTVLHFFGYDHGLFYTKQAP